MKAFFRSSIILSAGLALFLSLLLSSCAGATSGFEVLVTTFPIYQIARNVAAGVDSLNIDIMLPSSMGCPHDYILTPRDIRKLEKADTLIINGLGMEGFLESAIESAKPGMKVIDSSAGIEGILYYEDEHEHNNRDLDRDNDSFNPHLFASPRMAAKIAVNIAAQMSRIHPEGAKVYFSNANLYAGRMNRLGEDLAELGRRLKNNRVVTQHGVFDYLARDMGLKIIGTVLSPQGQDPSAAEMLETVRLIREQKAGAVFTEPQYPSRTAKTIALEAGIPFAELDPAATGPTNAPLDHYEAVMRKNIVILGTTLGTL
ncbi:MAG: metal ABC transporter substrate-binding protein [Thermovirgaceae bacterium]|nr:metal ABC transporter substrate-binding protein [Thermovirgaceae bacterium]